MTEKHALPDEPRDGGLNEWSAYVKALVAAGAEPGLIEQAKAVAVKLANARIEKASDWVLHPPRAARTQPSGKAGPTIVRRGEPDLFDVQAWQRYLEEYRGDEPSSFRDSMIEYAEAHLRAIGGNPEKSSSDDL